MYSIENQMMRLLAVSALGSFSLGGASWVVLLSARGFSMLKIGVAEGVFHIASLILEVPSGALADVYGRKRAMMLSHAMFILSSLLMIASQGLPGVFLQARLHASGLAGVWIGPALFVMGLGGALGAKLTLRLAHWPLRALMLLCAAGTLLGLWLGAAGHAALMVVGGFIAAMCDDILQVRTDSRLNELFPSEQRATILSISSLLFSLIMIVLSPLFGWFFGRL